MEDTLRAGDRVLVSKLVYRVRGGRAAGRAHMLRRTGVRLDTMNDDRGMGEPAITGSPGVELPGHDGDRAVTAEPEMPGGTGTMTPPPRRDATAQSGDSGGQATGPGGPGGASGDSGGQAAGPGGRAAGPARARSRRKRRLSWWAELLVLFVLALTIMLVIKTYVVQAFFIPSSSMENTLDIGDKVLVNKLIYHFRGVERGDVVVFNGEGSWDPPSAPQSSDPVVRLASEFGHAVVGLFGISPGVHDYIKRVIGLPGDHVACCDAQGRVTVNGVPLSEKSYLYPGNAPSMTKFSITVPPGRLWVMGDHRNVSYDSRGHVGDPGGGTIPENQVVGRAFLILWPPSRFRVLPIPATFTKLDNGQVGARAIGDLTTPAAPLVLAGSVAVPLTCLDRRRRSARSKRAGSQGTASAAGGRWPGRPGKRR
jgi:signal peptidase I